MYIGELAKKAGIHIQSIRFYERVRLLRKPTRTPAGYRSYVSADLERVIFIKWCQKLGFTLKEIRQLVELHAAVANCPERPISKSTKEIGLIIHMAQEKIRGIGEKINNLKSIQRQVGKALEELQRRSGPACPAARDNETPSPTLKHTLSKKA